jgi:hypothetical protein
VNIISIMLLISILANVVLYYSWEQSRANHSVKAISILRNVANVALRRRDRRAYDLFMSVADYIKVDDGNISEIVQHFKTEAEESKEPE